jgi:hypothetical protein
MDLLITKLGESQKRQCMEERETFITGTVDLLKPSWAKAGKDSLVREE